jgi:hypothetical protein
MPKVVPVETIPCGMRGMILLRPPTRKVVPKPTTRLEKISRKGKQGAKPPRPSELEAGSQPNLYWILMRRLFRLTQITLLSPGGVLVTGGTIMKVWNITRGKR